MTTEPSLFAEIEAENTHVGPRCTVAVILDELTPEDAAALRAAFSKQAFTAAAIARTLRKRGHRITDGTVQRHRKGECSCR